MYRGSQGTMRECELLLFSFTAGAFSAILFAGDPLPWIEGIPGGTRGCMSLLLMLAALLPGSMHAIWADLLLCAGFGVLSAWDAQRFLALSFWKWVSRIWPLVPAVILFFVLCVWGMDLSAEQGVALRTRPQGRAHIGLSIFMTLIGLAAAVLLLRSAAVE